MWVKICGMKSIDAVRGAVDAGVDAVGFVFAASVRQVNVLEAIELARNVPAKVMRVAVMQHPSQPLLDEVCGMFKPDVLQTDYQDLASLRIPAGLTVFPVIRGGAELPSPLPPRFLFEGPVSGTGKTADWTKAAELARRGQIILAGGLNPSNVGAAIDEVRPFGVDVSSGVESSPGVKDVKKIAEFVRAARSR